MASCLLPSPWCVWGWWRGAASGGSCEGQNWALVGLRAPVCQSLPHWLFETALMDCWSRKRNISLRLCVVQMVFLKVYFCACTVFLNNVSISTGKDKPRAALRICLAHAERGRVGPALGPAGPVRPWPSLRRRPWRSCSLTGTVGTQATAVPSGVSPLPLSRERRGAQGRRVHGAPRWATFGSHVATPGASPRSPKWEPHRRLRHADG